MAGAILIAVPYRKLHQWALKEPPDLAGGGLIHPVSAYSVPQRALEEATENDHPASRPGLPSVIGRLGAGFVFGGGGMGKRSRGQRRSLPTGFGAARAPRATSDPPFRGGSLVIHAAPSER